jgi:hypothetical protein
MTFLQAIAREEGFEVEGSRPQRNNNPGDLVFCAESERFGATHGDPRFAVFPDAETGWEALRHWLSLPAEFEDGKLVAGYLGATVEQIVNRFAPPVENNSSAYVANVCGWANVTPATIITSENLG